MFRLRNIAMLDYQRKCDYWTDTWTDRQTDAGQSDPYVPPCFAGDTKILKYGKYLVLREGIYLRPEEGTVNESHGKISDSSERKPSKCHRGVVVHLQAELQKQKHNAC